MLARVILATAMLALIGCNTPTDIIGPQSHGSFDTNRIGHRRMSPRDAIGHHTLQRVETIDPSGSTRTALFRADFVVLSGGSGRGNFTLSNDDGMTIFNITGGSVRCDDGEDVVVLTGLATTMPAGGGAPVTDVFTADVMPVDEDNPECIIWDIKDGCSHEAEGNFDVLRSACSRG